MIAARVKGKVYKMAVRPAIEGAPTEREEAKLEVDFHWE